MLMVHIRGLLEQIVLLIVLLLLEAEVVRLTGIKVGAMTEEMVAVEAEVLLQIMQQALVEMELLAKAMTGVVKVLIQLLIQEEAVEALVGMVELLLQEFKELEELEHLLILQDLP